MPTPPAEIHPDRELVARLLADQHPDLADLPIGAPTEGWDNVTFRLGEALAVRLPRRRPAAELAGREQRWLPRLPSLPLAIPRIVETGEPSERFPFPWSVVRWIDGDTADRRPPEGAEAPRLAHFLATLHQAPPSDAPSNPFRSQPLAERTDRFEARLAAAGLDSHGFDPVVVSALRADASDTPIDVDATWIHGDLHPRNVVVDDRGRIAGVIDWGDLTPGDPATDLSAAWSLFDPQHHGAFRSRYGRASDATWRRALGWAIEFALLWIVDAGDADGFTDMGITTLRRIDPTTASVP